MHRIADKIGKIFEQIHEFEQSYDRPEGSVILLAVSKKQPENKIIEAFEAGIRDFGENYVSEAQQKINGLTQLDITWHFIGPVQSNKTRAIADLFQWVHSVDRIKVARRLSEQRDKQLSPLNICIQVNLSNEENKSGVSIDAVEPLCQQVADLPGLRLRGLMAIPEPCNDFTKQRATFHELSALFQKLAPAYDDFDTLSMGMSGDFEAAIAEGATMIRIGTALFGPRE